MEILTTIAKFLNAPLIAMLSLAGFTVPTTDEYTALVESAYEQSVVEPVLGGDVANTVAGFETSLASSITSNDTQMTLVSFETDDDGVFLTVGKQYTFTIDEGSASREFVIGTASTSNRIVSMTRGISVVDGVTSVAGNKKVHRRGASVKITNFQLVTITNIFNDQETIPSPLRYESGVATTSLTNSQHLASKAYVDYVAFNGAGVVDATASAKGVVELATQTEMASSTSVGSSGPLVLRSTYSTSSAPTSAGYVPVTKSDGNIDEGFLPTTFAQPHSFSATTTITSTSSLLVGGMPVFQIGMNRRIASTTGTSTFNVPSGIKKLWVEVIGGGGNGGGCAAGGSNASGGGGGGAGGYAQEIVNVSGTSTIAYHVGYREGAGTQTTRFGSGANIFLQATGGSSGAESLLGQGGSASGGDINIGGQHGIAGAQDESNANGGSVFGGNGGSTMYGAGGYGTNSNADGRPGTGFGAGGGGGGCDNATQLGGAGVSGAIIIRW